MQVKTIINYWDQLYEMFPDVPKKDIKKIVTYGWKILYLYNSSGADTLIKDNSFWCYIGYLKKDSLEYFNYYIKKLCRKLRILYQRKKIEWDGYYYFALNESQYQKYSSQKNSRGRKRKKFSYGNVILYQILDECKVAQHSHKYIFKIPYIERIGFTYYAKDLVSDQAELILIRDPLKFKDILIYNNNYELI